MEAKKKKNWRELGLSILGEEHYTGLCKWYEDILQSDAEYVVFMVRRAYNLALIMENLTEQRMNEVAQKTGKKFLTDAALFLCCERLAQCFRTTGEFPKIILCDDTVLHGRNLNHCINEIRLRLISLLPEKNPDDIYWALERSLTINVYARLNKPSLLFSRYEFTLQKQRILEWKEMHYLSSKISVLISQSNIANTSYSYSMHMKKQSLDMRNGQMVETNYYNVKEKTWIQFIGKNKRIQAIASVRVKENVIDDTYQISPFVFFPTLNNRQTNLLINAISNRLEKVISLEQKDSDLQAVGWLEELSSLPGRRSCNELLTLIMNQVVLKEFLEQNEIDDYFNEEELEKIYRNFNQAGKEWTKDFLKEIITKPLFSWQELEELLDDMLESGQELILCSDTGDVHNLCDFPENEKNRIRNRLEDKFYEMGKKDEVAYYGAVRDVKRLVKERDHRSGIRSDIVLAELVEGYDKIQICYAIAYYLQMMDAGIIAVSSHLSRKESADGFIQCSKAGEMSHSVRVARLHEWLPLMIKIESYCNWKRKSFEDELNSFFKSMYVSLPDEKKQEIIKELSNFQKELEEEGQTISDWTGNYMFLQEIGTYTSGFSAENIIKKLQKQQKHVQEYERYLG